jgi:adenosylmethionine-8-amino-7-oxononanoate aminotransferase
MEKENSQKRLRFASGKGKVLQPDSSFEYPLAVRGDGVYIIGVDGKRYLDGSSGAYLSSIGHAVPEIAEAIYEQCRKLEFAHRTQFVTEPLLEMTDLLAEITPGDLKTVYFSSSGSESNETAIKVARRFHVLNGNGEKHVMLSRWLSYHGNTLGAQSLSGITRLRDEDFPLLHDWPQVAPCYCFRCPFDKHYPACNIQCAHDLEHIILKMGSKYVAAFFVEPIVGSSCPGAVPPPEYFQIIRHICDKYSVLLVADEVITSFGRTGKYFGMEHWKVVPDIITVGKGTSCGYSPLGATILSQRVYQMLLNQLGQFGPGHTLNFNPVSIAAAIAVQKYIRKHDLVNKAIPLGDYLFLRLKELSQQHSIIGDVRGKGLLAGLEFVKQKNGMEPFPAEEAIAKKIAVASMQQGLVVYPSRNGFKGKTIDFISVAPPLVISREQIDELITKLDAAISNISSTT